MGILRRLKQWREQKDGTLEGPALSTENLHGNWTGHGIYSKGGTVETDRQPDYGRVTAPIYKTLEGDIDVWIIAGQSNALGNGGDQSQAPSVSSDVAYEYRPGTDTLVDFADNSNSDVMGAAWPAFADEYNSLTGRRICVVQTAVGGTAQAAEADDGSGNWDTSGNLFDNAVADGNAMLQHLSNNGYSPNFWGVLWSQGETDAQALNAGNITLETYGTALSEMVTRWRDEFGDNTVFLQAVTSRENETWGRVADAQVAVATEHPWHKLSEVSRWFDPRGLMTDDVHYNQTALNEMGRAMGRHAAYAALGRVTSRIPGVNGFDGAGPANAETNNYTGIARQLVADLDNNMVRLMDGYTQGGIPISGSTRFVLASDTTLPTGSEETPGWYTSGDDKLGAKGSVHRIVAPSAGDYRVHIRGVISPNAQGTATVRLKGNGVTPSETTWPIDSTKTRPITLDTMWRAPSAGSTAEFAWEQNTGSDATLLSSDTYAYIHPV